MCISGPFETEAVAMADELCMFEYARVTAVGAANAMPLVIFPLLGDNDRKDAPNGGGGEEEVVVVVVATAASACPP